MKKLISVISALLFASNLQAAVITQSENIPVDITNYSATVAFNQFDDQGGAEILESVEVSFSGMFSNIVRIESLDQDAHSVSSEVSTSFSLLAALGALLDVDGDAFANSFDATAFDGADDFDGTSGRTYERTDVAAMGSETYTDQATLDFFTGDGTIEIMFNAIATSFVDGSGNIISQITTTAGGVIEITYNTTSRSVNAASMGALAALSAIMLVLFRRK